MMGKRAPSKHSLWRRELAQELVKPYQKRRGFEMALLGGSPARGLSDRYSDMDVVLYWDRLDADWIKSRPLEPLGLRFVTRLDMPQHQAMLEIYTLEGLIVEIGHSTTASLKQEINEVTGECKVEPPAINTIGGFLDAWAVHGAERYREIRKTIPAYPRRLAVKVIEHNLGFFWKGCLRNQGLGRGEIMFVYDGMTAMLKRLINILAALNGLYYWAGEPRWIEHWHGRMKRSPKNLWPRIVRMYRGAPGKALEDLEALLNEMLSLVKKHFPEADLSRVDRFKALEVRATSRKPKLKTHPSGR
jgi:hypothetical protein